MLAVDNKVFENTKKKTFIRQKRTRTKSEEEGRIIESEEENIVSESEEEENIVSESEEEENIVSESEEEETEMAEPSVEQLSAILDALISIRRSTTNPEYGVLNGVIAEYCQEHIFQEIANVVNGRLNNPCLRMDKKEVYNMVALLQKTYNERGVSYVEIFFNLLKFN
ncbi:hypothetical protein BVRB_009500 [Beta vulgaris subsp. vulgaris]|uniref:Uncharacterized protein n=1 Tax=Beta vulgaris subsp. vulgaris TaxID=3555 RepID=A0A0J8DWS3_BETVV|nr:hypothetical protein BVRB_009500 [Beta vulgaris subsp. vulgaris]